MDELFIEYLEHLFTKKSVDKVKNEHKEYWLDILKDFENAKTTMGFQNQETTFSILYTKGLWNENHFNGIKEDIRRGAYIKGKRLRMTFDIIKNMIKKVSKQIKSHGESLLELDELKDIDAIMMVGGFSNSKILIDKIKQIVKSTVPVVVPEEAELSVVKGAVFFGWNQEKVLSRRAKYTYGCRVSNEFVSGKHPEKYAYCNTEEDGSKTKWCYNVFDKVVTVNQEIKLDETISRSWNKISHNQTTVQFDVYVTSKDDATYVTDEGVEFIGSVTLNFTKGNNLNSLTSQFIFGGTELKVIVVDESSGETVEGSFAFLSQ